MQRARRPRRRAPAGVSTTTSSACFAFRSPLPAQGTTTSERNVKNPCKSLRSLNTSPLLFSVDGARCPRGAYVVVVTKREPPNAGHDADQARAGSDVVKPACGRIVLEVRRIF